jgi:hypothetical protein
MRLVICTPYVPAGSDAIPTASICAGLALESTVP